jgi:hypothetical protein
MVSLDKLFGANRKRDEGKYKLIIKMISLLFFFQDQNSLFTKHVQSSLQHCHIVLKNTNKDVLLFMRNPGNLAITTVLLDVCKWLHVSLMLKL